MLVNNKNFFVNSLLKVKKNELRYFYNKNFKNKFVFINNNWKWLYRTNFKKSVLPLAIFKNNKMIGHSGHIPFKYSIQKKKYLSSWFVDFKIIPEFQNCGYGSYLTQEWVKNIQIGFAFCNNKSLRVFKRNKWILYKNFFMFFLFSNPFNYFQLINLLPKKIRFILNSFFVFFF